MMHPSRTPTAGYGRSSAVKRAALLVLTAALFAACSDHREPTAARSSGLSADISDAGHTRDRKSTRLNSSHTVISYAVFCLKKKKKKNKPESSETITQQK